MHSAQVDDPVSGPAPWTVGRSVRATAAGPIRLFDADPELRGALLDLPATTQVRAAKGLLVDSWHLRRGAWNPARNPPLTERDCSFLLLSGLLLSRVWVGSRRSAELLGAGDIYRTDHLDTSGEATVVSHRSFQVLDPMRIVVLGHEFVARTHGLPGVASSLQRRLTREAHSLSVRLAIIQVPQLAERLHLVLWHLADRFGRRCRDGVRIPFRLSHEVLAECVSAQRTSVLAAIHELEKRGAVERDADGLWLLSTELVPAYA